MKNIELIDGKMVATNEWMDVVNPANEEIIGKVPSCGEEQLNQAVAAARQAFKSWSKTSIEERRAILHAIATLLRQVTMSFSAVNEGRKTSRTSRDGDWRRPRKYSRSSVAGVPGCH